MADAEVGLDLAAVHAFVEGGLDDGRESALADQVARLLTQPPPMPNPYAAAMTRLIHRLGGDEAVPAWLDRFPGRPRLLARLSAVTSLLDRCGDRPALVRGLRRLREREPYPRGLERYLLPATDETTLPDLGGEIRILLADDNLAEATSVALAALTLLIGLAPRAGEGDPGLGDLRPAAEQLRRSIEEAAGQDWRAARRRLGPPSPGHPL
jgi:hypothetical protein